ncbi:MAG: hypothetical protein V3U87_10060 [Methylococcaceae bacterium]
MEKGLPLLWEERTQKNGIYILNCSLVKRIPTAIVKQGTAHIANYFREKNEQGVDYLYEAKLLLVGDGRAGKTSLLRRLYQPDLPLPSSHP